MPKSLSQVILHIVFSTKDRRPWLDSSIRPRMHAYLATPCRDCDCQACRVGGTAEIRHSALTFRLFLSPFFPRTCYGC